MLPLGFLIKQRYKPFSNLKFTLFCNMLRLSVVKPKDYLKNQENLSILLTEICQIYKVIIISMKKSSEKISENI